MCCNWYRRRNTGIHSNAWSFMERHDSEPGSRLELCRGLAPGPWPRGAGPGPGVLASYAGACKILKNYKKFVDFWENWRILQKITIFNSILCFFYLRFKFRSYFGVFQAFRGRKIFIFRGIKQKFHSPAPVRAPGPPSRPQRSGTGPGPGGIAAHAQLYSRQTNMERPEQEMLWSPKRRLGSDIHRGERLNDDDEWYDARLMLERSQAEI